MKTGRANQMERGALLLACRAAVWTAAAAATAASETCPTNNGLVCSGVGTCEASGCRCPPAFGGLACEERCPTDALLVTCSGHGTCGSVSGACECHLGFAGSACALTCPVFGGQVCSGRGKCLSRNRQAYCECVAGDGLMIAGYHGEACQHSLFNVSSRLPHAPLHAREASAAVALLPILLSSVAVIATLLLLFRPGWIKEYGEGVHALCMDVAHDADSIIHHADDLLHARHHEQHVQPNVQYHLQTSSSSDEIENCIRLVYTELLEPKMSQQMTQKAATEEELRKSYKERPEHVPKKIWRIEVQNKLYRLNARTKLVRQELIAERGHHDRHWRDVARACASTDRKISDIRLASLKHTSWSQRNAALLPAVEGGADSTPRPALPSVVTWAMPKA